MQAIILAAGVGERLGPTAAGRPKSLLELGGETLLTRHCRTLHSLGIRDIHVVTGFRAELIDAELAMLPGGERIRRLRNPDFRLGSVVSLWTARDVLAGGEPVILMDADVLCDVRMLRMLRDTAVENCFLLDRDFVPGDEPVKLCIRDGRVVEFRKQIPADLECDLRGESVGFFRLSPAVAARVGARCGEYLAQDRAREPYEEVIRDLTLGAAAEFGYEDVTGMPWIEIDFPEDVERARNEILPRLTAIQ